MVITSKVDRASLCCNQLFIDCSFTGSQFCSYIGKTALQFRVTTLGSQSLGPVKSKVKMASTVVYLTNLAGRRLFVVQELSDCRIKSGSQYSRLLIAER